jgi:hypothetical protein
MVSDVQPSIRAGVNVSAFTFAITGEAQTECKRERNPYGKRIEVGEKEIEKGWKKDGGNPQE